MHSLKYNIPCTVQYIYSVLSTKKIVKNNVQYCTVQYTMYIVQDNIQCTVRKSVQYNMQCKVQCTVYTKIYSIQYKVKRKVQCRAYRGGGNFRSLKHIKSHKKKFLNYFASLTD